MRLKNELRLLRMKDDGTVASYLLRISQIRDEIQAIGENSSENELVTTTPNALPRSWDTFTTCISSWKEAPSFEQLWNSCAQEESRLISRDKKEESSQAVVARFKKNKWKKKFGFQNKKAGRKSPPPKNKKDLSRIQWYDCQ